MSNQAPPPPPPPGGGSYGAPPPPPGGGDGGGDQPPVYGGGEPPSYGGGQPSYGGAPQAKTSGLAIASLVTGILGLLSFCFCFGLLSIAAIVLGFLARRDIASSGGAKTGGGMAMAGLVMGAIGVVLTLALWIIALATGDWNYSYSTN